LDFSLKEPKVRMLAERQREMRSVFQAGREEGDMIAVQWVLWCD